MIARRLLTVIAACLFGAAPAVAANIPRDSVLVLCWHDVVDDSSAKLGRYAVRATDLAQQFEWLAQNGYQPVSLAQLIEARAGGAPLPANAVLLTFDDGTADFRTRVFPLLELYHWPALAALTGRWIEAAAGSRVDYDGVSVPRERFLSEADLREIAASGLVEFASHSYDLHRGVPGNPQGNTFPAAAARIWQASTATYESAEEWRDRIRDDLERNSAFIERVTGRRPRALVWPYGRYTGDGLAIARALGMRVTFTLGETDGPAGPSTPLEETGRVIVAGAPTLLGFAELVRSALDRDPIRSVRVDIDAVASADAAELQRGLSALLDRLDALRPNVVLLGIAEHDGDRAWFATRTRARAGDAYSRVAWQIESRLGAKVYATVPASWIDDREAIEDLASHALFTGLHIRVSNAADAVRARALLVAATRWRAPLRLALEIAPATLSTAGDATVRDLMRAAGLRSDDFAIVADGPGVARPDLGTDRLAITGPRVVVEVDARRAGAVYAHNRLVALERSGWRDLGVVPGDLLADRSALATLAPGLSLRSGAGR